MLIVTAILALLNCFFGYRLVRIWMALAGFVIGAVLGGWLVFHFTGIALFALISALILGILLAALAGKIYLVGVFIFCGGVSYFALCSLFGTSGGLFALYLVIAAVIGVIAVNFVRPAIVISTAIAGGLEGVELIFILCGVVNPPIEFVVGALTVLAGGVFQFSTTPKSTRKKR